MYNSYIMPILQERAIKHSPLCVGLDTAPSYIPSYIVQELGEVEAVFLYNKAIIKALSILNIASCVKVQVAFYEALGVRGMEVYSKTLQEARAASLITIADVKRGDIASSAAMYAKAHFSGDFEADILTINTYMGFDTLFPYLEYIGKNKSIFILLCTSNPGSSDIEKQVTISKKSIIDIVGKKIDNINSLYIPNPSNTCGSIPCGAIGAVVGATQKDSALYIRRQHKNTFFLIPGFGVQGGESATIATLLQEAGGVVNSSRAILKAWQTDISIKDKREHNKLALQDLVDSAISKAKESSMLLNELRK